MYSEQKNYEGVDHRSGYCSSNGVFYSKRPRFTIPENVDLLSFLFTRQFSDEVALVDGLTGRSLSYRELEQNVSALATGFSQVLGVQQHDVVVLLLPNSIEFPVSFLAVTWLGAVVTTLNPVNTAQELRKQISYSGAKYIITSAELLEKVSAAQLPTVFVGSMETMPRFSSKFSMFSYSYLLKTGLPNVKRPRSNQSDTVSILFSSGTTGRSKGVALTHRNYIAAVLGQMECDHGKNLTRILTVLPMYHAYGFTVCVLSSLARGISVIILRKFEAIPVLRAIQKYRVTHMCSVPPIVKALVNVGDVHQFDLRSWVQIACGAAPLGMETISAFTEKFPFAKFKQEYGMTETTGCISSLTAGDDAHADSSGILLPCWEAMVVDLKTKQPLFLRMTGELWVRGPSIMKGFLERIMQNNMIRVDPSFAGIYDTIMYGYVNNPKETEEAIGKNGWLRTGDIVKFDEDGYLYVVDRLKELVKYNGYQVAPAELEDLLSSHPAVLDCAIIPYPNKRCGQIPMACVVRREGFKITADNIMHWVAEQVAPYKKVRKVAFMDSIPKSAAGKILRRELVNLVLLKSKL